MKSKLGWILAIIFGLLLLLVLVFSGFALGSRGYRMHGYGGVEGWPSMMGGYYPMHPGGWGGMIFGWFIGLGVLILVIVAIIALVRHLIKSDKPVPIQQTPTQAVITQAEPTQEVSTVGAPPQVEASPACPNCGKPIQSDWSNCPYCGQNLSAGSTTQ